MLRSDVRTEATYGEVGSSLENQQYHPAIIRGMEPSSPLEMEASPTPAMKTVPKQTDSDQREDDDPGDDMDVVSFISKSDQRIYKITLLYKPIKVLYLSQFRPGIYRNAND